MAVLYLLVPTVVPVDIDHDGDVPVYLQLASILRTQIEIGELPPHRPIPSKKTLMQRHSLAGGTVERAIGVLRRERLVKTVIGRGMYVTDPGERLAVNGSAAGA